MLTAAPQEMQRQECGNANRQQHKQGRDNNGTADGADVTAGLGAAMAISQLKTEKIEVLILANVLKSQRSSQAQPQELQGRSLNSRDKRRTREQHPRCNRAVAIRFGLAELLDLGIGELVEIVEDEERRLRFQGCRCRLCAVIRGQPCDNRRSAPDLLGSELRSAPKIDQRVAGRSRSPKSLGKKLCARRRISDDQDKVASGAQHVDDPPGNRLVMHIGRIIIVCRLKYGVTVRGRGCSHGQSGSV